MTKLILSFNLFMICCGIILVSGRVYYGITSKRKEWWILEGVDHPIMNSEEHKQALFTQTITFLETI